MEQDESRLEVAQRNFIEAEARVAAQAAWIAAMKHLRCDTKNDEVVLAVLNDRLERWRDELARLRAGR